jgi:predicted metalloprotease
LVVLVVALLGGFSGGGGGPFEAFPQAPQAQPGEVPQNDQTRRFLAQVVGDVEETWERIFVAGDRRYQPTTLVLFEQATRTGCGIGSAQTGPFYCPADGRVYLDISFFRELRDRFGAPGDFAQAYVIAHEIAHHVQNQLGISSDVRRAQQEDPAQANELSIRLELQADCLAGVWAHSAYAEQQLEAGDLQEGLRAAAAVGDDRIQEQATGRIDRESWTHGSSSQRVEWFRRGFDSGDPNACDTFE